MKKLAIAALAGLLGFTGLQAQDRSISEVIFSDLSVTPKVGLMHFWGDLRTYDFYPVLSYKNENQMGLGLALNKGITNNLTWTGGLNYGKLQGTLRGTNRRVNNIYFNTNVLELSTGVQINLKSLTSPNATNFNKKFAVNIIGGLGVVMFESEVYSLLDDQPIVPMRGKGKSGKTQQLMAYMGMHPKWHINNTMDLGLEAAYRYTGTDKLDAWVEPGSSDDGYTFTALTFTYHFGVAEGKEPLEWAVATSDYDGRIEELEKRVKALENKKPEAAPATVVTGEAGPADTDGDGVPDDRDKERFSPGGAKVNADGVAEDADGDGVPDVIDEEPNTPAGSLVNFKGRKIDITERVIEREVPGKGTVPVDKGEKMTNTKATDGAELDQLFFETTSDVLNDAGKSKLDAMAAKMKSNTGLTVKVVGMADVYGDAAYNMDLSMRRANSAKAYLESKGIAANRLRIEARGEVGNGTNSAKDRAVLLIEQK